MGDDDAVDVFAIGQFGYTTTQLQQVFVGDAFRGNLHDLFATHVRQFAQFGNAGDQLFYADLGCLIGRAVGGARASTGDCAARGKYHDVREFGLGFDFLRLKGGGQEQEKGQSARDQSVESRFHYFSL